MAKTSTERQHAYLARRRDGAVAEQRVYAWLPTATVQQLDELVTAEPGASRRSVLIRLISEATR